jgi:6,7-dimethyl-8-ribityllumazine synthase
MASYLKNLSDFSHTTIPAATPYKFGIIVASWNAEVTGKLYQGAFDSLIKHGAVEENIISLEVAGSFELIAAADMLLNNKILDAVICIGCVIKGETPHFDYICNAVANGIANVGIKHTKPVIFGVLTTSNQEQALDRAGGKHGNKGDEAAITAIKMADLLKNLK